MRIHIPQFVIILLFLLKFAIHSVECMRSYIIPDYYITTKQININYYNVNVTLNTIVQCNYGKYFSAVYLVHTYEPQCFKIFINSFFSATCGDLSNCANISVTTLNVNSVDYNICHGHSIHAHKNELYNFRIKFLPSLGYISHILFDGQPSDNDDLILIDYFNSISLNGIPIPGFLLDIIQHNITAHFYRITDDNIFLFNTYNIAKVIKFFYSTVTQQNGLFNKKYKYINKCSHLVYYKSKFPFEFVCNLPSDEYYYDALNNVNHYRYLECKYKIAINFTHYICSDIYIFDSPCPIAFYPQQYIIDKDHLLALSVEKSSPNFILSSIDYVLDKVSSLVINLVLEIASALIDILKPILFKLIQKSFDLLFELIILLLTEFLDFLALIVVKFDEFLYKLIPLHEKFSELIFLCNVRFFLIEYTILYIIISHYTGNLRSCIIIFIVLLFLPFQRY